jgi:hypothetical protein
VDDPLVAAEQKLNGEQRRIADETRECFDSAIGITVVHESLPGKSEPECPSLL